MNDQRSDSSKLGASQPEEARNAILAQFYTAEYSVFMGRVSSWENLQYAAWPILITALAFLFQVSLIPWKDRWWAALIIFLLVYVGYQGTMVNMLYSVLIVERDLRPRASKLVGHDNFWIYERIRNKTFPLNPAWSMLWPVVISFSIIALVAGGLAYKYGFYWQDYVWLVIAVVLGLFVAILTQNAMRVKKDIVKASSTEPVDEPLSKTKRAQ